MLSKIPTLSWVQSHVGAIMGRKVQQRWIEVAWHQVFTGAQETGGDGVRESCVSVFPYLYPPVTTPKTDALYVLTVCRRSFCLFHCVFFFCLCCSLFFYTRAFTSVLYSGGFLTAHKQQHSPSRLCLMTYITFSLHGGTAGLHVVCA